jgi:hypothetical protein
VERQQGYWSLTECKWVVPAREPVSIAPEPRAVPSAEITEPAPAEPT